jgi:hypothetical protein
MNSDPETNTTFTETGMHNHGGLARWCAVKPQLQAGAIR